MVIGMQIADACYAVRLPLFFALCVRGYFFSAVVVSISPSVTSISIRLQCKHCNCAIHASSTSFVRAHRTHTYTQHKIAQHKNKEQKTKTHLCYSIGIDVYKICSSVLTAISRVSFIVIS